MPLSESWITRPQTLQTIDAIRERIVAGEDSVKVANSLRKEVSAERSMFILAQAELQIRARKKFTLADSMLFTRVGLEQSTSETIAKFKRGRLSKNEPVLDICCGIGGDAIGFSDLPQLSIIDQDETTPVSYTHLTLPTKA